MPGIDRIPSNIAVIAALTAGSSTPCSALKTTLASPLVCCWGKFSCRISKPRFDSVFGSRELGVEVAADGPLEDAEADEDDDPASEYEPSTPETELGEPFEHSRTSERSGRTRRAQSR